MADDIYGPEINQNVYEGLLNYNGTSSTQVIPWLASNYTVSSNQANWNFTLRSGITFADGEPLNSTAVYFSLYRTLLQDGSTPLSHGQEFDYEVQQFLNTSLSSDLCCAQTYNAAYVQAVLGQNFVQVTGPMTLTLHLMEPGSSFEFVMSGGQFDSIVAPTYVMQHDLALWNQSSTGYTLPYPNLSGNLTNMIHEYFLDEVATCNSGTSPNGCGTTYLDGAYQGSLAGTGPYTIQSVASDSSLIVLKANPTYWGGPYQYSGGSKITPTFTTVDLKNVPQLSTREIDLKNAAASGQAMIVDIPPTNLYDVANRTAWTNDNQLVSSDPGVSLYGPYNTTLLQGYAFYSNVTNPQTGTYYTFQPFADHRIRLAFADAVNMTEINQQDNNGLAVTATSPITPGIAPAGSYNASITPLYSYNLTAVQDLLLSAMEHPVTHFTFYNGTVAPAGVFNNTFGCTTLNNNGVCSNPVSQTITLQYANTFPVDGDAFNAIATAINNVSATYNMGLTVNVEPLPLSLLFTYIVSDEDFMNDIGGGSPGYNYITAILGAEFQPGGLSSSASGWYLSALSPLYSQSVVDASDGNVTGLVKVTNLMVNIVEQEVTTIYAYYLQNFYATTSIVGGVQYSNFQDNIYYFAVMS